MKRGYYIVLECGKGGGKTTQSKLLVEYLKGFNIDCLSCREPGTTKTAEKLRKFLEDKNNHPTPREEVSLFVEARESLFRELIIPSLDTGKIVVADRSAYSTEAYQGYGDGVDLNLIRRMNNKATRGIRPNLLFIIDIDAEVGLRKEKEKGRISEKPLEYHQRVNQGYREIAKNNQDISIIIPYKEGDISGTHEEIRAKVHERLHI